MEESNLTVHETHSKSIGHQLGFGSLHARLKRFSRLNRASQFQDTFIDQNAIDFPPHIPKTLLDLPPELIDCICEHLPQDGDSCLALTCRQLYYYIGTNTFNFIPAGCSSLAKFLQKLQKDRPDPNLWICYGCLRFHSTAHRYDPPNFRSLAQNETLGFPYCRSTYAKAMDEIYSRLHSPWTDEVKQMHWMEDDIFYPVPMSVYITCLSNAKDLMLRCRYHFNRIGRFRRRALFPERLLHSLGESNLAVCPHIVFASDWWRGDGSVMSALQELEEEYHVVQDSFHVFECRECRLDVEVTILRKAVEMNVTVWQYVGQLPPKDGCNDKPSNSSHTKESRGRPESKSLPLLTPLPSLMAKRFVLPKALSSRLESLKKRPGMEAQGAEAAVPSRPVALLPGPGSMQRRWESLEVETRESSVGVAYTALTVLEEGGQDRR